MTATARAVHRARFVSSAVPFIASMALGPLAAIETILAPNAPIWLPLASGGIGLLIGSVTVIAQSVPLVARLARVLVVVLALTLLAIATRALHGHTIMTWLVWPTFAAGLAVLLASALEEPAPRRAG